jgi:hypothetical protein
MGATLNSNDKALTPKQKTAEKNKQPILFQ